MQRITSTLIWIALTFLANAEGFASTKRTPQNEKSAFEIFQREVYPFLQERCAECHGKNQFDAPQHSPIGDPQASYKQILGYVHLSQDWEQSSRLISFGGTRHCKEYLNTDDCGADRAELLSVVRNWINAEMSARADIASNTQAGKKIRAKEMMTTHANSTPSNHNSSQSSNSKSLKIIQIATGGNHTCALFENKKMKCWGDNESGQLGIGSNQSSFGTTPQEIQSLHYVLIQEPILQIAAGGGHTCALLENKKMKCWGNNEYRQLGIGSNQNSFGKTPQEMQSLPYVLIKEPILQISAKGANTCALLENKKAKCWGNNDYGQLGIGSNKYIFGKTPQEMQSLPYVLIQEPILQITTGNNNTCALFKNKKAKCWGNNRAGQLGIGSNQSSFGKTPQEMQSLPYMLIKEPILQITTGSYHICVLVEDRFKMMRTKCWGDNSYGQLGIGADETILGKSPAQMQQLRNVMINEPILQIVAGISHTCALVEDPLKYKKAKCWGFNSEGQLGLGISDQIFDNTSTQMQQLSYVLISNNISQIAASYTHTCFLLENGKMKCTGSNQSGQLGTGDIMNRGGIYDVDGNDELPDALVTAQEGE